MRNFMKLLKTLENKLWTSKFEKPMGNFVNSELSRDDIKEDPVLNNPIPKEKLNTELLSQDVFLYSVASYTDPRTFFALIRTSKHFLSYLAENVNYKIRFTKKFGSKTPKVEIDYVYWLDLSHDHINATDKDLKMFPKLKILNIDNCVEISDEGLFPTMEKLIDLSCVNCPKLTEESFLNSKNLTELNISSNVYLPPKILKYLENIKILHMSDQKNLVDGLKVKVSEKDFKNLKNLKELYMKNSIYSFDSSAFTYFQDLEKLDLSNSLYINLDTKLENLKYVKYLNVSSNKTVNDEFLSGFEKLEYLNISYCTNKALTDEAFGNMKNLTHLSMRNCYQESITDSVFSNLSLKNLDISFCTQLTDKCTGYLQGIEVFHLSSTNLSTGGLMKLGGIVEIDVSDCKKIDKKSLKKYLETERNKVKYLDNLNLNFIE